MSEQVTIIGLWHQGVVAAACLADLGVQVLAADPDAARVQRLSEGTAPIHEPGLDTLIQKGLTSGKLRFTDDVASSVEGQRDILIMFDTPVDDNDQVDLSCMFDTATEIAPHLEKNTVILVIAQVPVGTCETFANAIQEAQPDSQVGIAYSPENLRLGQAIDRFMKPALPVIGADDEVTLDRACAILAPLKVMYERVSLRTAEMVKHALNALLATSVTFGNELGNICDEVGADGRRVAEVLRMEERIGSKAMLFPGLGFSGGTLARDMQILRGFGDEHGLETPLLDGVWQANQRQNDLVARKLTKALGALGGKKVAVLGLTYKPDTSTLRRSAAIEIIRGLANAGAVITAHDPKADREELAQYDQFTFCEDVLECVKDAEALVIITGWAEYRDLEYGHLLASMAGNVLIDCNNMLDGESMMSLGFQYMDVGRGR